MEKKTIANIIFYSFIVIVIIGMIYLVILLKSQGNECVSNPFIYGMSHNVVKGNQIAASCNCFVLHEGRDSSNFCFDDKSLHTDQDCFGLGSNILNLTTIFNWSE